MNGKIIAYSKENKTTFEVRFPIAKYGDVAKEKMK